MLATKKTKNALASQMNESTAPAYSDFAKKMLSKFGWSECVIKRRDGRARRPRALREVSLREVSLAPPAEEQHPPGGGAAASQAVV